MPLEQAKGSLFLSVREVKKLNSEQVATTAAVVADNSI